MFVVRCCALLAGLAVALPCSAAIVTLDLQVDNSLSTFSVFANLDEPSGLASFSLDILGSDGAVVLSRSLQAPRIFDPLIGDSGEFKGFSEFRSSGALAASSVTGMTASQDTISLLAGQRTITGYGVGSPVLLATGTYGGTGTLTAQVTPGFFFNVLPPSWTPGSNTVAATSVVPDSVAVTVPEPGSFLLAGIGFVALALWRRKRVS